MKNLEKLYINLICFSKGIVLRFKISIAQINQLNKLLFRNNRTDDLIKSASDEAFQERLLVEYGLLVENTDALRQEEEK